MSMNYKETVNLPETSFPMKGDLPLREPKILERWETQRIYQKILERRKNAPTFTFPDGPPYANGNLHIGHALNKILKDIVIKYKNMSGFRAPFVPGWDCHGLPIEQKVSKDLGGEKLKSKSPKEIRELCRAEANKWIDIQREQFKRMGVIGDWANPYRTMDASYEAEEIRVLARILKTGTLYRGEKPVYWCPTLQTALAEAEVEYINKKSPSIYVKFPITSSKHPSLKQTEKAFAVIWTTTPWTLPANLAVAVHPDFEYDLHESPEGEKWLLASGLKETFEKETSILVKPLGLAIQGKDLEGTQCRHPFYDRPSPLILGDHVTLDAGTGLVHTAPGHGQDDYIVGLKYGLKPYSPVDERGQYTADVPEYQGIKVWDANPKVIERLKDLGRLISFKEFEHAYPSNWRTKTPLIFRATPQWFLAMDEEKFNIRKAALNAIKENVEWIPKWGENRITGMISARPDWCLSRQRTWGVPIPVFYCEKCGHELASAEVMNRIADKMETSGGIEAFWDHAPSEFTQGIACSKCGSTNFKRGNDILDVWFDSGICFSAVHSKREGMQSPADLYLEGSDQHRGWFHTSLLASIGQDGRAPFKKVLTHGFVLYDKGVKMSKSTGLTVDPQDIISKSGAEILRLWAAHEDYANDLTCKPENFERIAETYRRLRNTARYLLGNLSDFDAKTDSIPAERLRPIDQWALSRLNSLISLVHAAYENYEFYKVYHLINTFVTVDLSSQYLDLLKDILYTGKKTGHARRSAQTVLHQLLWNLMGLIAPIVSFLPEEILEHIKGDKPESILLTDFPRPRPDWARPDLEQKFDVILRYRSLGQKKLEELRTAKTIGSSLEGSLKITAPAADLRILKEWEKDLPMLMIVSQVALQEGPEEVVAGKASGEKCERCWSYQSTVGTSPKFPGACQKCVEALS